MTLRTLTLAISLFAFQVAHAEFKGGCERFLSKVSAYFVNPAKIHSPASTWKELEDFWRPQIEAMGIEFQPARLEFYESQVKSPCGEILSHNGPTYCFENHSVYITSSHWMTLRHEYGAGSDAVAAYTLAHEYGHHIQKLVGDLDRIFSLQREIFGSEFDRLSTMMELTADAYAGYFLGTLRKNGKASVEDTTWAAKAAFLYGDDIVQRGRQTIRCSHGTGQQRLDWLFKGFSLVPIDKLNAFFDPEFLAGFHPFYRTMIDKAFSRHQSNRGVVRSPVQ